MLDVQVPPSSSRVPWMPHPVEAGPWPLQHAPMSWQEVWSQVMTAQIRFRSAFWSEDKCIVVFRRSKSNVRHFSLTERERTVFLRILQGERQKVIASDVDVAHSTVANCLKSAMLKLGFRSRLDAAPLAALVLTHHATRSVTDTQRRLFSVADEEFVVASAPSPSWERFPKATDSEREIAMLIVQGKSNCEIALVRNTSPHTVENQVASLFRKLKASGRFDLLKVLYG